MPPGDTSSHRNNCSRSGRAPTGAPILPPQPTCNSIFPPNVFPITANADCWSHLPHSLHQDALWWPTLNLDLVVMKSAHLLFSTKLGKALKWPIVAQAKLLRNSIKQSTSHTHPDELSDVVIPMIIIGHYGRRRRLC